MVEPCAKRKSAVLDNDLKNFKAKVGKVVTT